jgi:hypothetical protein
MARGGARGRAADPARRQSTWAKLLVAASKGKPLGSIADDDLVIKHTAGLRRAEGARERDPNARRFIPKREQTMATDDNGTRG